MENIGAFFWKCPLRRTKWFFLNYLESWKTVHFINKHMVFVRRQDTRTHKPNTSRHSKLLTKCLQSGKRRSKMADICVCVCVRVLCVCDVGSVPIADPYRRRIKRALFRQREREMLPSWMLTWDFFLFCVDFISATDFIFQTYFSEYVSCNFILFYLNLCHT